MLVVGRAFWQKFSIKIIFLQKFSIRKKGAASGTTVHTGLNVPVGFSGKHLPPLNDKMRSMLRNRLLEVKVITDKVSMVSNDLLLHIQLWLTEIFASEGNFPFAVITVIAVGDILQLPPVIARPVYRGFLK